MENLKMARAKRRRASKKENIKVWKKGTAVKEISQPTYPRQQRGGIQLRG